MRPKNTAGTLTRPPMTVIAFEGLMKGTKNSKVAWEYDQMQEV